MQHLAIKMEICEISLDQMKRIL